MWEFLALHYNDARERISQDDEVELVERVLEEQELIGQHLQDYLHAEQCQEEDVHTHVDLGVTAEVG